MIVGVAENLEQMKPEQYVLAFVFFGSYAFAIGQFIGPRGRRIAAGIALAAAIGFAARAERWEFGVMVVALALVGMGLFAGLAWLLWRVGGHEAVADESTLLVEDMLPEPVAASEPVRVVTGVAVPAN